MRLISAASLSVLLPLTGCALDPTSETGVDLGSERLPSFAPEGPAAASTSAPARRKRDARPRSGAGHGGATSGGATAQTDRTGDDAARSSTDGVPAAGQGRTTPRGGRAALTDARGDARGTLTSAPSYVDIVGAELTRTARGFTLRVTAAGAYPSRQEDSSRLANVAAFVDLDGDGTIDRELWGTLADDGWGTGYFDNDARTSAYADESGFQVRPDGAVLEFTVPIGHFGGAGRFRWSVMSEFGSVEQVATSTAARDYAPDDGGASFPG